MSNERILTEQDIAEYKKEIDGMTRKQIAMKMRFGKSGHPFFDSRYPLYDYMNERFKSLGGWSPELSKEIGWE